MQTNSGSLVATIMTLILTANGGFFKFRKGTEVVKEGILSGLLSAAYQNGNIGPLCSITIFFHFDLDLTIQLW